MISGGIEVIFETKFGDHNRESKLVMIESKRFIILYDCCVK